MKEAMKAESFLSRNAVCHKIEGDLVPLDIDHKQLQTKYNNINRNENKFQTQKRMILD